MPTLYRRRAITIKLGVNFIPCKVKNYAAKIAFLLPMVMNMQFLFMLQYQTIAVTLHCLQSYTDN